MVKRINPYKLFVGSFIPNWLMERSELTSSAKLIYARLAQYAGKDGRAFPKLETLAKEIGLSYGGTRIALRELVKYKLIETRQRGLNQSNEYYFLAHKWMDLVDQDCLPASTLDCLPVDSQDCLPASHIRESLEENHLRDKNPPAVDSSKKTLNPEIKEIADRLFKADPIKYKRLIAWIKKAEKSHVAPAIIAALGKYEPYSAEIGEWWPYLDKLLDKASKDYNRDQFEAEHNRLKSEGMGKAGDILRQLGLASFGNVA